MANRISMATRWLKRLSSLSIKLPDDKQRILDEFVALTGYNRKHTIRVLGRHETKPRSDRRHTARYGAQVREALVVLWEASDRLCLRRLKP